MKAVIGRGGVAYFRLGNCTWQVIFVCLSRT